MLRGNCPGVNYPGGGQFSSGAIIRGSIIQGAIVWRAIIQGAIIRGQFFLGAIALETKILHSENFNHASHLKPEKNATILKENFSSLLIQFLAINSHSITSWLSCINSSMIIKYDSAK